MSKDKKQYLNVICPVCGAFKNKECKHTSKAKKGKTRKEPHDDRVKLAKVKVSKRHAEVEEKPKKNPHEKLTPEQKEVVKIITEKIEVLGKHAEFVGPVTVGPVISTYRFFPVRRTKVAHLESLHKDFAVALGAESVLVKRMPGESAVGVFIPNKKRITVVFSDTLSNVTDYMQDESDDGHAKIPLNFGINSDGEPFVDDLAIQPHLLIAGATGSGKSTCQHGIALSMLWSLSPKELQIIISDTKGVEFKAFKNVPHLRFPICTDVYKTMASMEWCIQETQTRLNLFSNADVRNIHEYNARQVGDAKLPYVVFFIDELADVIAEGPGIDRGEAKINASKLGTIVARSRASGIHVIAATQRPSVNIVKGSIKSNFPSRLAFKLPSSIDSRTVLNTKGAEALMKRGDALYSSSASSDLIRIHAPYTSLAELSTTIEGIIARHQPKEKAVVPNMQSVTWSPKIN
jgi:S-DNA-T family DNA segregation ATPase FtsK/SpoIIIE